MTAGGFGIWELDLKSRDGAASASFNRHFGLDPNAPFNYEAILAAIHAEDVAEVRSAVRRALRLGTDVDIECRVAKPPGVGWVLLKGNVLRSPSGVPLRIVGTSLDVTQRHRADEERQQTAILLRAVLQTVSGLVYAKDIDGRMLMANPPTLSLIGKPWEQVHGRTDAEFLNDRAQGEAVMANDRRIMDGGRTEVLEEIVDTEAGDRRVWLSTKSPLRNDEGRVVGLVGISQDISQQKRIEERLRELNETLEARVAATIKERERIWNNSQDLLLVIDAAGTFRAVSPSWTRVLGYSAEELVDQHFLKFIHPDDHAASRHALAEAGGDVVQHVENRYRHKDGAYRWISWSASPEGDLVYASGRDITAEKHAAAALAEKAAQLEVSNKELESFSYSISHDLRAPLRAINGFGMILSEDYGARLDPEGRRLLAVIRENSQRMGMLIDDLLAFSRLCHAPLSLQPIGVESLVRSVIGELTQAYKQHAVEFVVETLAPAHADPGLLRQVWMNLLSNAIKYSSKRADPRVEISSRVDDGQIVYSVKDNGVGFDMQYVNKLFGVFQRLHAGTEFSGTGVGLAITYRIVTRHGGRISAEGKLNEGATFTFSLPQQPP